MMNPRVKAVKPNSDYTLTLTFTTGEVRNFDVKPYLNIGIFKELKDLRLFNSVKPFLGSIQWQNGQDFCPDTLYLESVAKPHIAVSRSDEPAPENAEAGEIV
ncbi:MAG: DUF2442 domain-containing protein [bacterium]